MSDTPLPPDTPSSEVSDPGVPRWVKVFGTAAALALVTAFVLMHTLGGGMSGH